MRVALTVQENPEIIAALDRAEDYRAFLKDAFRILKERDPSFGFAAFSRRAGFSARSLPRDVLNGKKITQKTLPGFTRALGLKGSSARYFAPLVYRDHPEEAPGRRDPQALQAQVQRLRERRRALGGQKPGTEEQIYRSMDWPDVFASIGSGDRGSTLEQISTRSGIAQPECERILIDMTSAELVEHDMREAIYRAKSPHLLFEKLGGNSQFKNFFSHLLMSLNRNAQSRFDRNDALFFASTVSIRRDRAPEFKNRLRELLSEFVMDIDQNGGDRVAHLACAFATKES